MPSSDRNSRFRPNQQEPSRRSRSYADERGYTERNYGERSRERDLQRQRDRMQRDFELQRSRDAQYEREARRTRRASGDRSGRIQVSMRDDGMPTASRSRGTYEQRSAESRTSAQNMARRRLSGSEEVDRRLVLGESSGRRLIDAREDRGGYQEFDEPEYEPRGRSERSSRDRSERQSRDRSGRQQRGRSARSSGRPERQPRASRGQQNRDGRRSSQQRRGPQYTSVVQQEYGAQTLFAPRRLLGGRFFLIIVAVALVVLLFFLVNAIGSCISGGVHPAKWGINASQNINYTLNSADLVSLPGTSEITGVSLSKDDASFNVSESQVADIKDALYKVEKSAHCGFVFLDISTGRTLAYNAEEVMYFASAVKAPLAFYALTHPESSSDGVTESERLLIENAIQWSSNDDYLALCKEYFNDAYVKWLSGYGVKYSESADGNFPSMNARSMAAIWADIYQYITGKESESEWLSKLFTTTETSFIRDGVKDTGATVRDKAGWISDGETDAVTDAGIITMDGRDYLMVILTGMRDTDKGHKNASELAKAIFGARGLLAPNISLTC